MFLFICFLCCIYVLKYNVYEMSMKKKNCKLATLYICISYGCSDYNSQFIKLKCNVICYVVLGIATHD